MPPSKCTGSCLNNSNEGTLFGSQNQMNGQGDQGTLKMNAVHMYCAAAKKILRAARARLQNLGSNLGYPGKNKLHIPSNIQSKHSKVLVPKLHALCVKALPIHPLHVLLLLGLRSRLHAMASARHAHSRRSRRASERTATSPTAASAQGQKALDAATPPDINSPASRDVACRTFVCVR